MTSAKSTLFLSVLAQHSSYQFGEFLINFSIVQSPIFEEWRVEEKLEAEERQLLLRGIPPEDHYLFAGLCPNWRAIKVIRMRVIRNQLIRRRPHHLRQHNTTQRIVDHGRRTKRCCSSLPQCDWCREFASADINTLTPQSTKKKKRQKTLWWHQQH